MSLLFSAELLDRRALALLRLVDVFGRPVTGPVRIHGEGVRWVRKRDGSLAILEAPGLEDVCASFIAPASPAPGSIHVPLDIESSSAELTPRRFDLALPRDSDPSKSAEPDSLFSAIEIEMLPGAGARLSGSACAIRATVRRKSDRKLIQNALVRARTEDEKFGARGLTDARGEAILLFPWLPLSFPGAGANIRADVEVRVALTVKPDSARFNAPADVPGRVRPLPPYADPDDIASVAADFSAGIPVTIGAGREVGLELEWTKP